MALLQDLIQQIDDPALRERILQETNKLLKKKKFGLVFEEHLPECTPLYDVPIRVGSKVALKTGYVSDIYTVVKIDGDDVLCDRRETHEQITFKLDEIVAVAEFGEPIYPTLRPIDTVENAPDSGLWHTLIEADNYHALQLLEYLYAEKVDCIYIDPPYNTGAKDWKYNNDYVDDKDAYRHSKWLSMMETRLKIAKKLLKPETGVLIVTIDEHEVHHLRTLLDQVLPEAYIQMVTIVNNPKGSTRGFFSRVEEYAIYCFMPKAAICFGNDPMLGETTSSKKPRWKGLLRSGEGARREDSKNLFYPVLIDPINKKIVKAGAVVPFPEEPPYGEKIESYEAAWPIRDDLSEGRWMLSVETFNDMLAKGYISLGRYDPKRKTWGISYLSKKPQRQIENGEIIITSRDAVTGTVTVEYADEQEKQVKTVWHRTLHDAGAYGSDLVSDIVGQSRAFTFPKSLYAERDSIKMVVGNNPDALIVDFFAGSGTTLHAVNLLNAEDNGNRRCVLVTNNEVANEDAEILRTKGFKPGDQEWESHGICKSVTWPRTTHSILGRLDDGTSLNGEYFASTNVEKSYPRTFRKLDFTTKEMVENAAKKKQLLSLFGKGRISQSLAKADTKYIVSEKYDISILFDDSAADEWVEALDGQDHIREFYVVTPNNRLFNSLKDKIQSLLGDYNEQEPKKIPMSEGFLANAAFFKISFLDKTSVALGRQFRELLPVLWMKSGAIGKCPALENDDLPNMLILPQNKLAVLVDEIYYSEFDAELSQHPEIQTVFIVTDSETAYRSMIRTYDGKDCYQLYRDYLDNFRINTGR